MEEGACDGGGSMDLTSSFIPFSSLPPFTTYFFCRFKFQSLNSSPSSPSPSSKNSNPALLQRLVALSTKAGSRSLTEVRQARAFFTEALEPVTM